MTSQTPHDTEAPGETGGPRHSEHASVREGSNPRGSAPGLARTGAPKEQGTRGFVQCSTDTGCGGRWTWRPDADLTAWDRPHSWKTEDAARAWADTHLTVCDGPVKVVVTHRDGEPA